MQNDKENNSYNFKYRYNFRTVWLRKNIKKQWVHMQTVRIK